MDENKNEVLEELSGLEEEEVLENEIDTEYDDASECAEEEDSQEAEKYLSKEMLLEEVISLRGENEALYDQNRKNGRVIRVLCAMIVAVAVAIAAVVMYTNLYNPYNHMGYSNFSGQTLQDVADEEGISLNEIKDIYDLPKDMKGDTYWDVAEYTIPLYSFERNYGISFDEMCAYFNFSDEVTREWSMGEAYDTVPLSMLVGEGDEFADFVEKYNLDSSVTPETPWGKVRKQVDKVDYAKYLEQTVENETEEVADNAQDATEELL